MTISLRLTRGLRAASDPWFTVLFELVNKIEIILNLLSTTFVFLKEKQIFIKVKLNYIYLLVEWYINPINCQKGVNRNTEKHSTIYLNCINQMFVFHFKRSFAIKFTLSSLFRPFLRENLSLESSILSKPYMNQMELNLWLFVNVPGC